MKELSFLLLISVFAASCHDQEQDGPAGGPCRYEVKKMKATVLAVIKKDSAGSDILFRVTDGERIYRDSVSWYMQEHSWVTDEMLAKDTIRPGTACDYEIHRLTAGSCAERREFIKLNRYDSAGSANR